MRRKHVQMLEALIAAIGQSAKAQGNTFWTRKLTMGTPVQVHLAVMVEPYLSRVLDGSKTIESRFSRKNCALGARVIRGRSGTEKIRWQLCGGL